MHHVAVVPEAVPAAFVLLAAIEIEQKIEMLLDIRMLGHGCGRQRAAVTEHPRFHGSLWGRHDDRWRAQSTRELDATLARRRPGQYPEHELARARHTFGRTKAGLVVLVRDVEALLLFFVRVLAEAIVIKAQVHGRRGR